jgi:hypothetical protein
MRAESTDQALAWKRGTMTRIESLEPMLSASGEHAISAWITVDRCEYSTPLGLPVVPEV